MFLFYLEESRSDHDDYPHPVSTEITDPSAVQFSEHSTSQSPIHCDDIYSGTVSGILKHGKNDFNKEDYVWAI